jgi:hypothetical protein
MRGDDLDGEVLPPLLLEVASSPQVVVGPLLRVDVLGRPLTNRTPLIIIVARNYLRSAMHEYQ